MAQLKFAAVVLHDQFRSAFVVAVPDGVPGWKVAESLASGERERRGLESLGHSYTAADDMISGFLAVARMGGGRS